MFELKPCVTLNICFWSWWHRIKILQVWVARKLRSCMTPLSGLCMITRSYFRSRTLWVPVQRALVFIWVLRGGFCSSLFWQLLLQWHRHQEAMPYHLSSWLTELTLFLAISMYNRRLVSRQLSNFCLDFYSPRKNLLKISFSKFQKEENTSCSTVRESRCRSKCLNGINTSPVLQQRCQAGVIR